MKLSLQSRCQARKVLKVVYAPLVLSLFLPGTGWAKILEKESLRTEVRKAAKWENVTGTIKDSNGDPVAGVTVKIKGTNTGTVTDVNGVFRINLPTGNETLVISFIGFNTQEIAVAGRTQLNIALAESTSMLDEVIFTGYGEKKRSEIVGSVATITGEELMDIPSSNIAGAMRNRIAGVGVNTQGGGRPGAPITLNIRNATTSPAPIPLITAEPLYIIDGITVEREAFDNLDASMIENISILKDASAAIYGASGAKGVMLVTTKRGKQGKPSITYNGYVGVSDATRTPDMLSGYEHALLVNATNRVNNGPASNFFSPEDLEYIRGLNYESWYDQLWKPATTQRHNVGISGGSDKVTFFAGGSYQNENANFEGFTFDKYTFRSGITATILPGLKADIAFNVDQSIRGAQNNDANTNGAGIFSSLITTPEWVPLSIDGMLVNYNGSNPLGLLRSGYYENTKSRGYRINASLSYQPEFIKGLTARLQLSQGGNNANSRSYRPPYDLYNFVRMGNNGELFSNELQQQPIGDPTFAATTVQNARVNPTLSEANSYQGFFTLQYGRTFGLHSLDLTVGGEQSESNNESLGFFWNNQLIPGGEEWWAFDSNTLTRGNILRGEGSKRSFFGRFSYDIDKKYLLEGVARLDASSNFATGNRWGLSPSLGFGWIVSKEDFFKNNISFINFLKFKVNYGITGDDRVGSRFWQERYTIDTSNGYLYGTNNGNSLNPSVVPNLNITWEKKRTFNAGVEMSLLNNKIDIGMEFFQNYGYDVFDQGGNNLYPLYAGIIAPVINYREVYNWGSEFTIGYKGKIANEINFNANMNFSYGNSVVDRTIYAPGDFLITNLADGLATAFGTDPRVWNSGNLGLKNIGMFRTQDQVDAFMAENPNYRLYNQIPQPGWLYYEDTNEDGVINDLDLAPMYKRTNPAFASGINLGMSYKAFNLSTNIFAQFGGKVFYDSSARERPSATRNVITIWEDRWTPENPMEGKLPRFDDPSLNINSNFWAVDATTIRINNMTFSYRVPEKVASRLGLGSARLLATGNNLWTIVNPLPYKDPYIASAYNYPIMRTISLGLSVTL